MTPCGYQQLAAVAVDAGTRLTVPNSVNQKPTYAIITAFTQAVRWRDDGTNATAAIGMPLPVNMPWIYDGDLNAIHFISQTAGAELNVSYYYGARYA